MPFCPNSSFFRENNARNINYMPVLIFPKRLDFEQVSADSEMLILGQAPSYRPSIGFFTEIRLMALFLSADKTCFPSCKGIDKTL